MKTTPIARAFVYLLSTWEAWRPGVVVEAAQVRQRLASKCHAYSDKAKVACILWHCSNLCCVDDGDVLMNAVCCLEPASTHPVIVCV